MWFFILFLLGNYLAFYKAIKAAYPKMQIISNCDASSKPLNHPADMYDYHVIFYLLQITFIVL